MYCQLLLFCSYLANPHSIYPSLLCIPSLNIFRIQNNKNNEYYNAHQVRDPVVVNVSYFFHFSDDGTLPEQPPTTTSKSLGVLRAATLLYSTAQFRQLVATGTLPYEAIGRKDPKTPLCSVAYKYMFNACRIPRKEEDTYRIYDPSLYSHVIVACGGHFYSFDFVERESGEPLPMEVIEGRLQQCVELSSRKQRQQQSSPSSSDLMLGYLTSNDRDSCANAREELIRVGGSKMEEALKVLESGAVLICLDENVSVLLCITIAALIPCSVFLD